MANTNFQEDIDFMKEVDKLVKQVVRLEHKLKSVLDNIYESNDYNIMMSREEASRYLGVTPEKFDKRVETFGIWKFQTTVGEIRYRKTDLLESEQ